MARNGSGTMSVTNSFTSGTTISSSGMNANFSDVASEITNSLPRDGQAGMTGQLQATAGSATAPGIAFSGDTNTGVFRKAADTLGFAAGGTEIANATSTAFNVTGLTATSAALTTPTIAGATLSGTLAGTPTFSGEVSFGAAPTLSDGLTVSAGTSIIPSINIENADTTITRASAGVIAVEGSNVLMASGLASQSDQETGTSTTKIVTSGTQKHHPLSPKAWFYATISGTTITVAASSGITSVTRSVQGKMTVVLTTAMSSANYATICSVTGDGGGSDVANTCQAYNKTTTQFEIVVQNGGTTTDGYVGVDCIIMGDQ